MKKILSLILALLMITAFCAACDQESDTQSPTGTTGMLTEQETTEEPEQTTEQPTQEPPTTEEPTTQEPEESTLT